MKKKLDSTLISLCNYAIPSNDILDEGLGDLLLKQNSSEIEFLKKELIIKYTELLVSIKHILAENEGLDGFEFSDIIDQLILIHGRSKCYPFKKDLNSFCAQAYFSNKKVLDVYKLSLNINQIKEILGQEDDNLLFSKLINK